MNSATYSPEDDKIRIYPATRLDAETYAKVKECGYGWAPKQGCFYAVWTPSRETLAIELCGEIGDEDKSLVERAEERAERFDGYSDNRKRDAVQAEKAVAAIADGIPLGQPILVGHHSERHARRDAEKIERGMQRALKAWETSEYWKERAAGALAHAKYKELPRVRANRIKKIEAERRRIQRDKNKAEVLNEYWNDPKAELNMERALGIANYDTIHREFKLSEYPRQEPISQYEGSMSLWSALDHGIINAEQAKAIAVPAHNRVIAWCDRWLNHLDNRLTYEKAMLEEQGASALIAKKPRPKQLPLVNYRAPEGIKVENIYSRGKFEVFPQLEMTKDEYAKIREEYRGCAIIEHSHRVRICFKYGRPGHMERFVVFLTDSKVHEKPAPVTPEQPKPREPRPVEPVAPVEPDVAQQKIRALKDSLKGGVKAVSAEQLFPTPAEIAKRMAELAEVEPGMTVLEPSAGTGNLIKALRGVYGDTFELTAVEYNHNLCEVLRRLETEPFHLIEDNFLEYQQPGDQTYTSKQFDRVVMNPPFKNAEDIKHINHALGLVKPGGVLVALCANGPRQNVAFKDVAEYWEPLPEGSFEAQGTGVNVALMVIRKAA